MCLLKLIFRLLVSLTTGCCLLAGSVSGGTKQPASGNPQTSAANSGQTPDTRLYPQGSLWFHRFDDTMFLPQNYIQSLTFDNHHRLWVGTQEGVAVYNGHVWKSLSLPNRRESNYVNAGVCDSDGNLWFASNAGLHRLSPSGEWATFQKATGQLLSDEISSLLLTGTGPQTTLWVGTAAGLGRLRHGAWTWFTPQNSGLPGDIITCLAASRTPGADEIWVGTQKGMAWFQHDRWQTFSTVTTPLPSNMISALWVAEAEATRTVWVGTLESGMARLHQEKATGESTWEILTMGNSPLPNNHVSSFAETRVGSLVETWVGTASGLLRWSKGAWTSYTKANTPTLNAPVRCMQSTDANQDNILWIGTGKGLLRYQSGLWETVNQENSPLGDNEVFLIKETGPSETPEMWFGTEYSGLSHFKNGVWETFTTKNSGLPNDSVNDLLCVNEPKGQTSYWVATENGLGILTGKSWKVLTPENSPLPNAQILRLAKITVGDMTGIAVGTRGGLAFYQNGKWDTYTRRNSGLPDDSIYALQESWADGEWSLWIGTRNGLTRHTRNRWETYHISNSSLPNNWVNCLHESTFNGKPYLWVGTDFGLARIDLTAPATPWLVLSDTTNPALPNNMVLNLAEDRQGRLYVGTNQGVTQLRFAAGTENPIGAYTFTTQDGLPSSSTSHWGSACDGRGRIWVGTSDGAACLSPVDEVPTLQADLFIERVLVNGTPVSATQTFFDLPSDQNTIVVEYAFPYFFREASTRFETQLEGLQPTAEWTHAATQKYTGLSAGVYTFRVRAHNVYGQPTATRRVTFRIRRAPWVSWWAIVGYISLSGWGLYFFFQARMKSFRQRNRLLEEKVRERTRKLAESEKLLVEKATQLEKLVQELRLSEQEAQSSRAEAEQANRAKSEFLANMSHELRTPLSAVIGMTSVLHMTDLNAEQADAAQTIKTAGESLLSVINDILDFSKIEAGMMELEKTPFSLKELVEEVVSLFSIQVQQKNLTLLAHVGPTVPDAILGDSQRIRQILLNLMGNAVKFTATGKIVVSVAATTTGTSEVGLEIAVADTGIGISPQALERLFKPFSQGDSSMTRKYGGTGLGLTISRRLAEKMGGTLEVKSSEGQGSTFYFRFQAEWFDPHPAESGSPVSIAIKPNTALVSPLKILLAEDHPVNQKVTSLMLRKLGYQADIVNNGLEVLEFVQRHRYDLILMDLQMPEMDGVEATRRIRANESERGYRPHIVALTASVLAEDRENFFAAGIDDFLGKPVKYETLSQLLDALSALHKSHTQ